MVTAGGADVLPWAAAVVRDGGAIHYFAGGPGDALPLPLGTLYHRELTVTSTYSSSPATLARAFWLLAAGKVEVDGADHPSRAAGATGRGRRADAPPAGAQGLRDAVSTMRAMVFHGPGDLRDERVPVPEPRAGEVVLRIEAALTCGTDVKTLRRGHPVMIPRVPTVFGHEFAGTVAAVGAGVRGVREGIARSAPTPRRAGPARSAGPAAPTSARICCSSTAPTASSSRCRRAWSTSTSCAWAERRPPARRVRRAAGLRAGRDRAGARGSRPDGRGLRPRPARLPAGDGGRRAQGAGDRGRQARAGGSIGCADWASARCSMRRQRRMSSPPCGRLPAVAAPTSPSMRPGVRRCGSSAVEAVGRGGSVLFFGGCAPGTTISVDTRRAHYEELTLLGSFHHTPGADPSRGRAAGIRRDQAGRADQSSDGSRRRARGARPDGRG